MSDFYKMRKEAFNVVAEMYANNATRQEIIFKISSAFGFSSRFVDDALKTIEELKNKG